MHLLRAEKGFIIVGQDTDGSITPIDLGLTWMIGKNKKDLIEDIFNQQTNLLVGSQIIGKSFHFPNLKLVNVIDGDSSLFSPDFRAMEKTYQLLQQVAGRSGREGERGKVYIQTYNPQHPIFQSIKNQNRNEFIQMELSRREQNQLPPYTKISQLQFIHPKSPIL